MLANKAQLESDFHLKRVPTILTIERREKGTKKERPLQGRGQPSLPLLVVLGERTGAVSRADQIFSLRPPSIVFSMFAWQELADKVHCWRPPNGRYQRKIRSFVQPDAFEHLRRRQREETPQDQNVLYSPLFPFT